MNDGNQRPITIPGGPYDYAPGYRWAYVYTGWDGVNRLFKPGGEVVPPF